MDKIELLAPAGSLEKAKTAILYGADAVYIGGQQFSLRSRASNFTLEEIAELSRFAKEHGAHVHVTVNMLPHEEDLEGLEEYLLALDAAGIDAIIAASPMIVSLARRLPVHYEVHLSTQHSTTNSLSLSYWKDLGVDRVVLAREVNLDQIAAMTEKNIVPIEAFIHGGMCISYSGRCVLSNHMTLRDANRGGCAQSCRWKYHLMEAENPEEEVSDPDNLFSMSSKDLQSVDYIEDLIRSGVASLKIEGRMKSAYYLAVVVSSYRRLIDEIYEKGSVSEEFKEEIRTEIAKAENRPTGPGFYNGDPDETVQLYRDHDETVTQEYIGLVRGVRENGDIELQVKNHFTEGVEAEVFGPGLPYKDIVITNIRDEEGNPQPVCSHPMQVVTVTWDGPAFEGCMVRMKKKK